ncbi:DNA-directed RNA polymerase N-terminal protein [Dioscorea alata]|uniref:DNA-directed RNA polymerase N-terminal protein n=1 Tax=Dioscorea alata TaxID=55571 RepID=A0ACB7V0N8_DIOAL|nr:DNA-directed RNA polymerase N-terminal protein [Dioscorea alata]
MEQLSEEDRRALRGSKFAPLPAPAPAPASRSQPRLAHPGGPMTTNKAAALAKFLERKLQQPDGLSSINPDLLELAVKNAKETVKASNGGGASSSGVKVRHVASFGDAQDQDSDAQDVKIEQKKQKKKKRKKALKNAKLKKFKS